MELKVKGRAYRIPSKEANEISEVMERFNSGFSDGAIIPMFLRMPEPIEHIYEANKDLVFDLSILPIEIIEKGGKIIVVSEMADTSYLSRYSITQESLRQLMGYPKEKPKDGNLVKFEMGQFIFETSLNNLIEDLEEIYGRMNFTGYRPKEPAKVTVYTNLGDNTEDMVAEKLNEIPKEIMEQITTEISTIL